MSDTDYQGALDLLVENLPQWWPVEDPDSTWYSVLSAIAAQIDPLSESLQTIFSDRVLALAGDGGVGRLWYPIWGISNEELAAISTDALKPYVSARIEEDGSVESLVATLTALITGGSPTIAVGTILIFPGGGGGLTFPASGIGLTLWQWDGVGSFPPGSPLRFPPDGSGLVFPPSPLVSLSADSTEADDGTTGISPASTAPLTFATGSLVAIEEDFTHYRFTVKVNSELAFDRPTFARAVERFRPAHTLPPIISEVP